MALYMFCAEDVNTKIRDDIHKPWRLTLLPTRSHPSKLPQVDSIRVSNRRQRRSMDGDGNSLNFRGETVSSKDIGKPWSKAQRWPKTETYGRARQLAALHPCKGPAECLWHRLVRMSHWGQSFHYCPHVKVLLHGTDPSSQSPAKSLCLSVMKRSCQPLNPGWDETLCWLLLWDLDTG